MRIAMLYPNNPSFGVDTHDRIGIGGSESGFIRTCQHLVGLGHEVHVFNRSEIMTDYGPNLKWGPIQAFNPAEPYDVVYCLRHREPFQQKLNARLKVLFLADTESHGLGDDVRDGNIDLVMAVSHWQAEKINREERIPDQHWVITSNGIDYNSATSKLAWDLSKAEEVKVPGRCIYMGTPERGLAPLIEMWPRIKAAVPHATLHLYSSFRGWMVPDDKDDEFAKGWYDKVAEVAHLDVVNHKHTNADGIKQALISSEVYLYPTDFYETCCMSVLEAMYYSVIPVATARAALQEKVVSYVTGYAVPAYGVDTERYRDLFVGAAVSALTGTESMKAALRYNSFRYAERFTYDTLVPQWAKEWQSRLR